jgi:iron(III) transport system substrate-binding protein
MKQGSSSIGIATGEQGIGGMSKVLSAARLASIVVAAVTAHAAFAAECPNPVQLDGFKTCADVAAAEKEGEVVLYTTSPDINTVALLDAFHTAFPKIATNYVRVQAGGLYAKLLSERRAGSYLVDVMQMSDMSLTLDFQHRNGWEHYLSPELAAYKPDYQSDPPGFWAWSSISMSGIAYNTNLVPPDQAPKTWQDALDPKWTDKINVKTSIAGVQHDVWYELRELYGDAYWTKFAELRPHAFDSWVQQFERCSNGQDTIIHTAQYSSYLQLKAKGAPLGFTFPPDGLPVDVTGFGIVGTPPHPAAARLFEDWLIGVPGQTALAKTAYSYSVRTDVPPPEGGVPLQSVKLLYPKSWSDFLKSQQQFVREWNRITGLR